MTEEEFKKQFNGSPFDDEELAECASKVKGELGSLAKTFLKSRDAFFNKLDEIEYEFG